MNFFSSKKHSNKLYPTQHAPSRLYSTAAFITVLSVAERALGFLYRIILSRFIGAEGVGIYHVALSIVSVFLTITTGGLPITVSRFTTKHNALNEQKQTYAITTAGVVITLIIALPLCMILWLSNSRLAFLFSDTRCLSVFRVLLILLLLAPPYAVLRSSFCGKKEFLLPSIIEFIEECIMVIIGVLLLRKATTPMLGAISAAWAFVFAALCSLILSLLAYLTCGGKFLHPKKQLKPLFISTLPITCVRFCSTLVNSAVAVLLPVMLIRAGVSPDEAVANFGVATGMAIPFLMIPATIIGSVTLVLMPELSERFYKKQYTALYDNIKRGIWAAVLVSCFLLPFFYALGEDLGRLAFSNALAGEMIRKGCIILLPMSISMLTGAALNAMGYEKQTLMFYFIGAATMLLCIFILPSVCGVYAYIIGMGASFIVNSVCNLLFLAKRFPVFYKKHGVSLIGAFLKAVCVVLPLSLLGGLSHAIFKRYLGASPALLFTGILIGLATIMLWKWLRLFPKKTFFSCFFARQNKKS